MIADSCRCHASQDAEKLPAMTIDFLRAQNNEFFEALTTEQMVKLLDLDEMPYYHRARLLAARLVLKLSSHVRAVGGSAEFVEDMLARFAKGSFTPADVRRELEDFESTFELAVLEANLMLSDYPQQITGVVED